MCDIIFYGFNHINPITCRGRTFDRVVYIGGLQSDLVYTDSLVPFNISSDCETCGC